MSVSYLHWIHVFRFSLLDYIYYLRYYNVTQLNTTINNNANYVRVYVCIYTRSLINFKLNFATNCFVATLHNNLNGIIPT